MTITQFILVYFIFKKLLILLCHFQNDESIRRWQAACTSHKPFAETIVRRVDGHSAQTHNAALRRVRTDTLAQTDRVRRNAQETRFRVCPAKATYRRASRA